MKTSTLKEESLPTKVFGETSTTDEVLSGVNLKGKRVLVTGVSSGLGVETAHSLAAHGAQVVGAARDLKKADAATDQVRKDAAANGGSFELVALDLASLTSVRACADALLKKGEPFDVIIANAGVMATPFGHTEDGFETQFGTNHLGHFVLVNRIAPLLRPGGRLINLASAGHRFANVDLQDPNFERTPYDPWVAYGRSKTANILFAVAFDARHRGRGIRAAAVHPGGIQTELSRHLDATQLQAAIDRINRQSAAEGGQREGAAMSDPVRLEAGVQMLAEACSNPFSLFWETAKSSHLSFVLELRNRYVQPDPARRLLVGY
jgi:NAD(P)-dependent dehydrogenase (short-subunit alcohol dehydrogenase family)